MTKEIEVRTKYLGIPYKHLGRTLDGLDCWGLPILIYREIKNIDLFDMNYEKDWAKNGKDYFVEHYYKKWVKQTTPKFLDILLFSDGNGRTYHAGVYLSNDEFIQGSSVGVIITRLRNVWKQRLTGIYRYEDGLNEDNL